MHKLRICCSDIHGGVYTSNYCYTMHARAFSVRHRNDWQENIETEFTYGNDDEVEPTPSVGEVLAEAVGADLDNHLEDEDDRERLVEIVQNFLQHDAFGKFDIDVFGGLIQRYR